MGRRSGVAVSLESHLNGVEARTRAVAERLDLPPEMTADLTLAARLNFERIRELTRCFLNETKNWRMRYWVRSRRTPSSLKALRCSAVGRVMRSKGLASAKGATTRLLATVAKSSSRVRKLCTDSPEAVRLRRALKRGEIGPTGGEPLDFHRSAATRTTLLGETGLTALNGLIPGDYLAAVGVLRALDLADERSLLRWQGTQPHFTTSLGVDEIVDCLVDIRKGFRGVWPGESRQPSASRVSSTTVHFMPSGWAGTGP